MPPRHAARAASVQAGEQVYPSASVSPLEAVLAPQLKDTAGGRPRRARPTARSASGESESGERRAGERRGLKRRAVGGKEREKVERGGRWGVERVTGFRIRFNKKC